jgi:uncharacterized protein
MVAGVCDVPVALLQAWEIDGIALDLDNTIVPWHTSDVAPGVAQWVQRVREAGVKFCLLTNNYAPHVRRVGAALSMPVVRGALKPLPGAFAAAQRQLGTDSARTLVIGDQLFTDVLGAKAAGMRAIVVVPLGTREFPTTKLLRAFERPVYARLARSRAPAR